MVLSDELHLESLDVGAAPLVRHFLHRLDLHGLFERHLPVLPGRLPALPSATVLCLLVTNLLLARQPLYALPHWAARWAPSFLVCNRARRPCSTTTAWAGNTINAYNQGDTFGVVLNGTFTILGTVGTVSSVKPTAGIFSKGGTAAEGVPSTGFKFGPGPAPSSTRLALQEAPAEIQAQFEAAARLRGVKLSELVDEIRINPNGETAFLVDTAAGKRWIEVGADFTSLSPQMQVRVALHELEHGQQLLPRIASRGGDVAAGWELQRFEVGSPWHASYHANEIRTEAAVIKYLGNDLLSNPEIEESLINKILSEFRRVREIETGN